MNALVLALMATSLVHAQTITVTTTTGDVFGQNTLEYNSFEGIPFAEPPVGPLRFLSAVPKSPWTAPLDATAPGFVCLQQTTTAVTQSEDCLHLNVWTPPSTNLTASGPWPVLIYIHGGSFTSGAGSQFRGADLVKNNVVVVTLNYRLGALGFFSSPDLAAENGGGNGGLTGITDQIQALKWIQSNLAAFGGDPASVTVFGESAGGLSTCMLAASPLAAGLFDRVAIFSGACNGGWGPPDPAIAYPASLELMAQLGTTDLAALRAVDATLLMSTSNSLSIFPCVDGHVLTESPGVAWSAGNINAKQVVLGVTSLDGLFPVEAVIDTNYAATLPTNQSAFKARLGEYFDAVGVDTLSQQYLSPSTQGSLVANAYLKLNSDVCLACPSRALHVGLASAGTPTPSYLYEFTWNPLEPGIAWHSGELTTLFGYQIYAGQPRAALFPAPNANLSATVQEYLTNFAGTGSATAGDNPAMPKYAVATSPFTTFNLPVTTGLGFKTEKCAAVDQQSEVSRLLFCGQFTQLPGSTSAPTPAPTGALSAAGRGVSLMLAPLVGLAVLVMQA